MKRRSFLQSALTATGFAAASAIAATPETPLQITRIRYYRPSGQRAIFNQSSNIIVVETDQGVVGVGEGGSTDTVRQCGAMLIGENPLRTEHLWQMMYRGYFYPAGREKLHALGGLDLALWDIKGKVLGVPVHQLLGGPVRDHVECYSTAFPSAGSPGETARACIEAGFRAYRMSVAGPGADEPFSSGQMVRRTYEQCRQIRDSLGDSGDWAIDYHTRLDLPDAVRLSSMIEDLEPFFAEDLVRSENPGVYRTLRGQVKVPIAVGEQFGDRWDINELLEEHLIDYSRVTLPNAGGITEFVKLAALCETHYVGLVPHFTGPVATAALAHVCGCFPGPVLMEILGDKPKEEPHLPLSFDFQNGKVFPNSRPGLGVVFDSGKAELLAEITEPARPIPMLKRPDGSYTNW